MGATASRVGTGANHAEATMHLVHFCVLSDAVVARRRLPEPLVNLRPFVTSAESCHFHPGNFPKQITKAGVASWSSSCDSKVSFTVGTNPIW